MSALPAPLTAYDCDIRGSEWMPILGARLFSSDFDARASDLEFRVAMRLWWAAWQQVPAASLPDEDAVLCKLAGLGRDMRTWRKLRAGLVLYGFVLCSDGRFYHPLLAEQAIKTHNCRLRKLEERQTGTERMRRWREGHNGTEPPDKPNSHPPPSDASRDASPTSHVTPDVTITPPSRDGSVTRRTVQDSTEKGREVSKLNYSLTSSKCPASAREATAPEATISGKSGTTEPELTSQPARNHVPIELLQMHLNRLTQKLKPPHTPTHARSPAQQIAILNAPTHPAEEPPPPINEMQSEVVVTPRQHLRPLDPIRSPAQQIAAIMGISDASAAAFLTAKTAQPHTAVQAAA